MKSQSPSQKPSDAGQLGWVNNLRLFALFAVIMLHCSAPLLGGYGKVPQTQWLAADLYNALTRFAVPAFVMITGVLLLGKEDDVVTFLKKRLSRVVVPFLFWSLVYVAYAYYNEDIPYTHDAWTTAKQVLHQLKYGASYHLWYVYMLIGLYLVIPILGKFIRHASEKEIIYFLVVWLLIMLIAQPYMQRFDPHVDARFFAGYIGYLVLGYYLADTAFSFSNKATVMLALVIVSVAGITWGTAALFQHYHGISTLLYEPLSWPIVILSGSMFLLFRYYQPKAPALLIRLRDFVGKYNYGIYLSHALILTLLDYDEDLSLSYKTFNPFFSIPVTALVCFLLSLLLVFLISKIPFIGKYISG